MPIDDLMQEIRIKHFIFGFAGVGAGRGEVNSSPHAIFMIKRAHRISDAPLMNGSSHIAFLAT